MHTLFETFAAPNVYLASAPVLELYAAGRENGVVLGVGAQCTAAVLVHEGLQVRAGVRVRVSLLDDQGRPQP